MSNMKTFPNAPYFDDFDETKGFLSILFRPGFPVQTRELNQLQTILQHQIGILGDSFFENGSRVFGGETQFNTSSDFVKLKNPLARENKTDYIGAVITNGTLSAKIVHVEVETGTDPETIYVQYTGSDTVDPNVKTFGNDQAFVITLIDSSIEQSDGISYVLESASTDSVGLGTTVSISTGVFYNNSRFITVPSQTIVLSKYTSIDNTSYSVGISATETIITPEDDSSILDNASGATSETAPGAHRYAVIGRFVLKEDADTEVDFIETVRIENQQVVEQARSTDLSVLNDVLAKRTYDESGDYVVDEFLLDVREHLKDSENNGIYEAGEESKLVYILDPGKAYIRGYSVETISNTYLEANKARTTDSYTDVVSSLKYESYIIAAVVNGSLPEIHKNIFFNDISGIIGYAVVRNVRYEDASSIRIELSNIRMNPGYSLSDALTAEQTVSSFTANVVGYTIDPENSSLVFKLPYDNVSLVNGMIISYNSKFSGFIVPTTVNTINLTHPSDTFSANEDDYIVSYMSSGNLVFVKPTSVTPTGTSVSIEFPLTPAPDSAASTVICKLTRVNGIARTKTSTTAPALTVASTASIALPHADVYEIVSVISGTVDIKDKYTLISGQTDSVYENSSIELNNGEIVPTGNVIITYKYFEHGIGDYFVAQSYDVDYKDIPTYTDSSGNEIFLADAIDFRCKTDADGIVISSSITANSFDANGQIIFDMSHYLPRIDKIALDTKGNFTVISGIPDIRPEAPKDPQDAIVLYDIEVPAYTFKTSDLTVKKRQQKRYTMKDVGNLERRIENLEYYTTLSLLEVDAANRNFPDTFKTGFIVDNFETQEVADTASLSDLRCSFDLVKRECRPEVNYTNVNVEQVSISGLVVNNGMVSLPYTETPVISQLLASVTERIQPFIRYSFNGNMTLSPSGDTWFSTLTRPDILLDRGTLNPVIFNNNSRGFGNIFGFWRQNWTGLRATNVTFSQRANVTQLRDTVVNTSAIPFIRSRRIRFSVTGMKPHTRVYPFFDGVNVTQYCGMTAPNQALITDASGSIANALFDIPNNNSIRFRTGVRAFKLVDNVNYPSTEAVAMYSATGTVVERVREFITTRILPRRFGRWTDPIAQSFMINENGGCFVSSIDLFFGPEAASNTFPVTVQIRNMVNGYPGEDVIKSKTLPATSILGSSNASVKTKFTFDSIVHLEKDKEYCFVVMTDSEILTTWSAKLGEKNIGVSGSTSQVINKQPYLGSMFKSQNNTTWTAAQEQDIKFEINRAKFTVGSGSITLSNNLLTEDIGTEADTYKRFLGDNVLSFTNGSNTVEVSHRNHGFVTGDTVFLTSTSTTAMNGIPASQVYAAGGKTVTVTGIDSYTISTTTAATSSGKNGLDVTASQKIAYSTVSLGTDEIVLNGTLINWEVSVKDKNTSVVSTHAIIAKEDFDLHDEKIIEENADGSLSVTATLQNSADNLSPLFDIGRTSVTVAGNRIDTSNLAQYVQKSFRFTNPANELRVFLQANIPSNGSSVEVQYRYGQTEASSAWQTMTQVTAPTVTFNSNDKVELEFLASSIPEFSTVQIRVVMKSNNPAKAPRISNVRAISLFR